MAQDDASKRAGPGPGDSVDVPAPSRRRSRLQRRVQVGYVASMVVGLAVAVSAFAESSGHAAAAPASSVEQARGMVSGLPFRDPRNLNTGTPSHLKLRLVAAATRFDLDGKRIWGDSYDGSYIGPTMHFRPGERVTLTFVNKLPTATNLHFHGMHVSPSGSADNPYISVPPGRAFVYHLNIPRDQPQGTFWYHDHDMCMGDEAMAMPGMPSTSPRSSSCADIESQIFAGLSGTIIVGDDRSLLPPGLRHITAHTLVFKDLQIDKAGHILQNAGDISIDSDLPTVRLVNGELRPVLTMRPGQTELWRLSNEGADIFYKLRLDGYRFTVIGQDGYPSALVTTANTLLLPPAKRYDVLVTAGADPGQTWLRTLALNTGPGGDSYPDVELMKLRVAGTPTTPRLAMPTGAVPTAEPTLATAHISRYRILKLSEYLGEATTMRIALMESLRKIVVFLFAVLTIVVIAGALMYQIEGEAHGFTSIPAGTYWAIVTVTTVGYGDIAPQTVLGRVVASLLMIVGYGIIAVPTGIVSFEFARATSGATSPACPECNLRAHDRDAHYCKRCGAHLRTSGPPPKSAGS